MLRRFFFTTPVKKNLRDPELSPAINPRQSAAPDHSDPKDSHGARRRAAAADQSIGRSAPSFLAKPAAEAAQNRSAAPGAQEYPPAYDESAADRRQADRACHCVPKNRRRASRR